MRYGYDYYDYSSSIISGMSSFLLIYIIVCVGVAIIFGCITKAINERKGRYGGFAWGFWLGWIGIIVVACRPAIMYQPSESIIVPKNTPSTPAKLITPTVQADGKWQCSCGRQHAQYVSTCTCGMNKLNIFKEVPTTTEQTPNVTANNTVPDMEEQPFEKTANTTVPNEEEQPRDELANIAALKEYKALLDSGIITQEEFEAKKSSILSR